MVAFAFILFFSFLTVEFWRIKIGAKKDKKALAATEKWCDASAELEKKILGEEVGIVVFEGIAHYPDMDELAVRYLEAAEDFYQTHPFLTHGFEDDPLVRFCRKVLKGGKRNVQSDSSIENSGGVPHV